VECFTGEETELFKSNAVANRQPVKIAADI